VDQALEVYEPPGKFYTEALQPLELARYVAKTFSRMVLLAQRLTADSVPVQRLDSGADQGRRCLHCGGHVCFRVREHSCTGTGAQQRNHQGRCRR